MSLAFQIHASLDAVEAHMLPIMYPACIPEVSLMYLDCVFNCRHDASKIHVSLFCISVYPDVS